MEQFAIITLFRDGVALQRYAFVEGQAASVTIGHAGDGVDLALDSDLVSRRHACIHCDEQRGLYITDLGSTNGTFVNNQPIPENQNIPITPGMSLSFASDELYRIDVSVPDASGQHTADNEDLSPENTAASIQSILQRQDTVTIGRSDDCDIVLDDETISRHHARVDRLASGAYQITDLNSLNGTFVNGQRLSGYVALAESDIILIGNFRLGLTADTTDLRNEVAIRAEQIVKQYPNGYMGLHETSINIPARCLLAIMGPSGCGKSTLMKALNGDDPNTSGRVFIHGLELADNFEYLKPRIGYVPQDDIVHRELTVDQSLYYAAKLRMTNPHKEVIDAKINQILADLNIEHIRGHRVGEISGGQRKRVSIAVELLTDPLILFLDEPTSPLDPQTIEEFLGILRNLSDSGTTVIMVTHKPEDLAYMDRVIFMAEGGHLVYYGSTNEYTQYFRVASTVEVYANISGPTAEQWVAHFRANQSGAGGASQSNNAPVQKLKTPTLGQIFWLTRRYLNIKVNDRVNTFILLAQAPVIALLLCVIFENLVSAVPFLVSISAIWFGASNAAREIVGELPIYRRERMFNLKITPYILSKLIVLMLFGLVQAILFVGILAWYFSSGESPEPVWNNALGAIGWMVFLSSSAALMGLFLSALVNTSEKVMALVPIILIPQIILAGFIARISNWSVELVSWLTLSRWGTEGFHIIQQNIYLEQSVVSKTVNAQGKVVGSETQVQAGPADAVQTLNHFFLPDYSNKSIFGELTNTLWLDSLFVGGLGLLFFILTWVMLKKKDTL